MSDEASLISYEADEGMEAADRGEPRSSNPYEEGSVESTSWFLGFDYQTELNQGSK